MAETAERRVESRGGGVITAVHPEDFIYDFLANHPRVGPDGALDHYLTDGRTSADQLLQLIRSDTAVDPDRDWSLLEFASGYGCVTRHLPGLSPRADIVACDIHQQAMDFIDREIGVPTALSTPDPAKFWLGRTFDVVFALSFFSHMPDRTFGPWLEALFRHVRVGGSLIFTTHGQISRTKVLENKIEFSPEGFYFSANSEQHDLDTADYGTAMTAAQYVTRHIHRRLGGSLAMLSEGYWWGHQDVYVVSRR